MARFSEFALLSIPAQAAIFIRRHCASPAEFPEFIGGSFQALSEYLAEAGELMTDFPYVAYQPESGGFMVEAGFTVPRVLSAKGDITSGFVLGCKAVMCMYLGSYEGMEPVYGEMAAWSDAAGLRQTGKIYEYYYNGPDTPPEGFLIRILMPVE
ncbi:effector-binding domain-containing protein [Serratia fonticola]|jgi:effector-binding domain-containing protein|uniref:Effector-binding domain-containing protein n=1 Tax=Serratia fonticola TaxID=47917 RepID=A0A542D6F6_SERFO|nr:GyrI-like domain-containing protein [Serratia fonticola]TQI79338.1 effector-binding domain-containing protein [Serratia fonticola]TQI98637.1 effector-binding domain-containing protein [Serratia fonticola]TVZ68164.1 effector-binding domain-containing protein [Serratia fonticola]